MTKKDYEAIAAVIYATYPTYENEADEPAREGKIAQIIAIVNGLADRFQQDNPRFDRQRFGDACFPHYCTIWSWNSKHSTSSSTARTSTLSSI